MNVDGACRDLTEGDTVVVPAEVSRRAVAKTGVRLLVCGRGTAVVRVPGEDAPRGTPPWIGLRAG